MRKSLCISASDTTTKSFTTLQLTPTWLIYSVMGQLEMNISHQTITLKNEVVAKEPERLCFVSQLALFHYLKVEQDCGSDQRGNQQGA